MPLENQTKHKNVYFALVIESLQLILFSFLIHFPSNNFETNICLHLSVSDIINKSKNEVSFHSVYSIEAAPLSPSGFTLSWFSNSGFQLHVLQLL